MEKLRGLIIENDRSIPITLEAFKKDRSDIFSEIKTVVQANFYPEDVKEAIGEGFNAIIGLSTFIHKEQLENTVKLLDSSTIKYQFFFHHVTYHLNEFIETVCGHSKNSYMFQDYKEFINSIHNWVSENRVYEITSDYDAPQITDTLHNYHHLRGKEASRFKTTAFKVIWNPKYKIFHLEHDDLKSIKSKAKRIHR